jgi:hypothetical protein
MVHGCVSRLAFVFAFVVLGSISLAQSSTAPVARAYISGPTSIRGYAVAPDGKVTPLPGSPYSNHAVTHLSSAHGFLFGPGADNKHVYTYAIAANGSIRQVASLNTTGYSQCLEMTTSQVDRTGTWLYVSQYACPSSQAFMDGNVMNFKIRSDGSLQFLGNTSASAENGFALSPLYFLTGNKIAYQVGCYGSAPYFNAFQRESTGMLQPTSVTMDADGGTYGCVRRVATDGTGHVVLDFTEFSIWRNPNDWVEKVSSVLLYRADAQGSLHGINGTATAMNDVNAMSISPGNNFLVVGGPAGFQIFHYNPTSSITHYSNLLQPKNSFEEFGWDKSNHLYALSTDGLRVYKITPSAYSEAPGSPVAISGASSIIVVPLQ